MEIQTIEIKPDERYLIVLTVSEGIGQAVLDNLQERNVQGKLEGWWKSEDKFYFVILDERIEFKLERVEDDKE